MSKRSHLFRVTLTPHERMWLQTRGGRNLSDVFVDHVGKKFILLFDGRRKAMVRDDIPSEQFIKDELSCNKECYNLLLKKFQ